ncbi:3'-5' exonuclease [Campylobacter sp. VBCF_01 NA2]|uniref:3'-5' exonuclease n=1 Tax=Campylobacter sp. VBCF_01 NA2 TaxID=2983836 RepID=UPI0022E9FED1|nr:3'-5' exonuclease [Campylobacter sp. VBCF_01 NA2]WBR53733.1 3'-5' exonuclease [Campylobacter sp. VBCF_01 NA2]
MNKKQSYICVFDCETVLDTAALLRILDKEIIDECYDEFDKKKYAKILLAGIDAKIQSKNDSVSNTLPKIYGDEPIFNDDKSKILNHKKLSIAAMAHFKEKTGSEFLPINFHKVVSISAVLADEFGKFVRVSTLQADDEKGKIKKFIDFINSHNPRLVSFNGRGFDLPMIMVRAMVHNISASEYFCTDDKLANKDKWTNYRSRYDGVFHLDLLDHICDFGSVRGLKLDFLCASLGLPGKYDVHGDQVLELFYDEKGDKIDEYCQSDTLNTYWLFLKYELLRGKILLNDYLDNLNLMSEYLQKHCADMGYSEIFCEFIAREIEKFKNE